MRSCVRTTLINFFDPLQKRYRDKGDVIWLDRKSAVEIKVIYVLQMILFLDAPR